MFLRSRVQSITGSVRTQKWERRRKDGRPESCVGSYEPTWFSHQVCLWAWRTSRRPTSHGSDAEEPKPRTQLPPSRRGNWSCAQPAPRPSRPQSIIGCGRGECRHSGRLIVVLNWSKQHRTLSVISIWRRGIVGVFAEGR